MPESQGPLDVVEARSRRTRGVAIAAVLVVVAALAAGFLAGRATEDGGGKTAVTAPPAAEKPEAPGGRDPRHRSDARAR